MKETICMDCGATGKFLMECECGIGMLIGEIEYKDEDFEEEELR